jgi:plastocyanin
MIHILRRLPSLACALALAACAPCPLPQTQPAPAVDVSGFATLERPRVVPADSVRFVEVEIRTTAEGAAGEFAPAVVHARRGDALRFQMADGDSHHNVSFVQLNDPVPGVRLPADSPFLTNPGQSWQVRVDLPPGTYRFACIPHHDTHTGTLIVDAE